ncbi:MAG TPA: tail fiber domain-containing protein [Longimicrobium sp.]|nr:tail fiber domain-containing protein [Longimicrobium sp.]
MKHHLYRLALAGAALLALAIPASAQSDILLQLQSTGSQDRFRVDSASGVVARGNLGIGLIPWTGSGERMMWHPFRAIFVAGGVNGTQWDDANLGFYGAAFGYNPTLKGNYSFVTGYQSQVQQSYSVAMGYTANSNGVGAIAIGYRATADSDYSLALGHRASTNGFDGAMVISDNSTTDSLEATANNQMMVRAAGGYRFYSNATETVGAFINAGGSSWSAISDRNRKQDFLAVDGEDLLARLRTVPVSTWRYISEEDRSVRHMGPMAQDWHRAFGFSSDSTTINSGDFDGVNLSAIQALEARIAELRARTAEVERLRAELTATQGRLEALEAAVRKLQEARP